VIALLVVVGLPVAAAVFAVLAPPRWSRAVNAIALTGAAAVAATIANEVIAGSEPPVALAGYLRADPLAAIVAMVVALAGAIGAACGTRASADELHDVVAGTVGTASGEAANGTAWRPGVRGAVRAYAVLSPLLVGALLVAALADDLGILWISLELAAVLAAFLIASGRDRRRHEAAFKYMLLGSAGLVFGLLATAVVHYAAVPSLGHGPAALSFHRLVAAGPAIAPETMRIAFALALAGYGLKVGLFPLHVWKPDAYAAAPGAVTAVLAGAGVLVPLEAVIRFGALCSATGDHAAARQLFVAAGVLSMVAALVLVVRERDLRRIMAFTSVEHLGLVLLALGLGPDAARGGVLHLVANGVLKALAFGLLGLIVAERGSADTQSGPGLYHRSYALTAMFLVVMAAGLGFPPFGMFTSELAILRAAFTGGHLGLGLVIAGVLAAMFGLVGAATIRLLFARSEAAPAPPVRHGRAAVVIGVPVLFGAAWLGMGIPPWFWDRLGTVVAGFAP
jgi:hydrogenase-4 component F